MFTLDSTKRAHPRTWIWCTIFAVLLPGAAQADDFADVSKLLHGRQYKEALVKIDQYLSSKPGDAQMRFLRGLALTESGRGSEAVQVFSKITEDFPELPEPHNNLAVLYASQNQLDKARASLELAIRSNPNYATAHENLGDVHARLANQAYSRALQLDTANAGLPVKLAAMRTLISPEPKGQQRLVAPVLVVAEASAKGAGNVAAKVTPSALAQVLPASQPSSAAALSVAPPANPKSPSLPLGDVEMAVRHWAAVWSKKDADAYLKAYAKEFAVPTQHTRKTWEEERRKRIVSKGRIDVQLSEVNISGTGNRATAKFRQSYSSDAFQQTSQKSLELVLDGGRWLITREIDNP